MMESIYPQRGGIHEQVYLLKRELERRGIKTEIIAYSKRREGQKITLAKIAFPFFHKKNCKGRLRRNNSRDCLDIITINNFLKSLFYTLYSPSTFDRV
ncbi:hypothetical protein Ahos_1593 [Acidianus hospitalis W1]|uniref:Uncharacterized protein n=1 Tax=Acidianus hospitalis (strain W1) TaxID=933801 RepID=F4B5X6_ACIHW|nr:hypothetical protein Ahos_1593 [Acidianus hospitalis W1]